MDGSSGASGSVWRLDGGRAAFPTHRGLAVDIGVSWRGFWRGAEGLGQEEYAGRYISPTDQEQQSK